MDYENSIDNDNDVLVETRKHCEPDCVKPRIKRLEPVLVTRVFLQPIIEELPRSAIQLEIENNTVVIDAHSKPRPPYCDI
ncbi:MAG: hypothetical protein FWF46_02680 [Oscillospiraceae bacterium]|nr:hypothetical protein [Oscillospiraceae bacterium]